MKWPHVSSRETAQKVIFGTVRGTVGDRVLILGVRCGGWLSHLTLPLAYLAFEHLRKLVAALGCKIMRIVDTAETRHKDVAILSEGEA